MKLEREQELVSRLSIVQKISLSDAMELLDISESTARRLFAKLEQDGKVIRIHGGIQSTNHAIAAYSFEQGAKINIEQKTAIGREAVRFLEDGDVIFCDSGTTIQCFCAEMIQRLQKDNLNIIVYTNSLANLEILSPYLQVKLVGGEYRANRKDFCGYLAEQALKGLYFTKCFLGADGCVAGRQFTTTDFETLRVNEIAMSNAEKTFMLVDASKFALSSHVAYAPVQKIHTIVTDDGISEETVAQLKQNRVQVICANTRNKPYQIKIVE